MPSVGQSASFRRQQLVDAINAECERRIGEGFTFNGYLFALDAETRNDINAASTAAIDAVSKGAEPGDIGWPGPGDSFSFPVKDESVERLMDAQTTVEFGRAAFNHFRRLRTSRRDLIMMDPIPADYADDKYWP